MEALLVHRTEPIYPEAARQAHVQGIVILKAVIGTDGTVADLTPISGPEMLVPAALDAVKWWRFEPYYVDGKAVPVETTVALDFREN
jgi:protein TonB